MKAKISKELFKVRTEDYRSHFRNLITNKQRADSDKEWVEALQQITKQGVRSTRQHIKSTKRNLGAFFMPSGCVFAKQS